MSGPSGPRNSEREEKAEIGSRALAVALGAEDAGVGVALSFVRDVEQAEAIAGAYGLNAGITGAIVSGLYGAGVGYKQNGIVGAVFGAAKEEVGFTAGFAAAKATEVGLERWAFAGAIDAAMHCAARAGSPSASERGSIVSRLSWLNSLVIHRSYIVNMQNTRIRGDSTRIANGSGHFKVNGAPNWREYMQGLGITRERNTLGEALGCYGANRKVAHWRKTGFIGGNAFVMRKSCQGARARRGGSHDVTTSCYRNELQCRSID